MDGSSFNMELVQFELDQQRRRKEEEAAARREAAAAKPIRMPASAWLPLLIWLSAAFTAMQFFAWA